MSGNRKHGQHAITLALPALTAGASTDAGASYIHNAYPEGSALVGGDLNAYVDPTQYACVEASFVTDAVLTGQATNYPNIALEHYNSAGTLVDKILVAFSAAGVVTGAQVPVNLNRASGAVATGAGTGVIANPTGVVLPWKLQHGDCVVFARRSTGTGEATPPMSCTIQIAESQS